MKWTELKEKHSSELNSFPMFFAFSDKQFEEGKEKLGVTENSELASIGGGGAIRKTDGHALKKMFDAHRAERETYFTDDRNLLDALVYELGNHEYCVTYDAQPAVESLELPSNDRTVKLINKAIKTYNTQQELIEA